MAGRGWGKTRTGGEAVREWVKTNEYVNLIGATLDDARDIMVEGESGILAICPDSERPIYRNRQLIWPNGAKSLIFTADEPERLRGKQHMKLWADELGAWRYSESWDQAMFGLRLGKNPQAVITTTPKPVAMLKEIIADKHTVITRGTSYENRANLAPAFFDAIVRKYEGTRLGRQELEAELLDDVPGALWTQKLIDRDKLKHMIEVRWDLLVRIVVAIDPAVSHLETSDETGIVVAALTQSGHVVVLDDLSGRYSAAEWASVALAAYRRRKADVIVAEVNNGGDLVAGNIHGADPAANVKSVRASRGKYIRAEPVAALYEQGRVHHVGSFPDLENQMCMWTPQSDQRSPDRLDALVWAITELVIAPQEAGEMVVQFNQPYRL